MSVFNFVIAAAALLTTATEIDDAIRERKIGEPFVFTGVAAIDVKPSVRDFALANETGSMSFLTPCGYRQPICRGDVMKASGHITLHGSGFVIAVCNTLERQGRATPPDPFPATIAEVKSGRCDHRLVTVRGQIREVFRDEIDPQYCRRIVLTDGTNALYASFYASNDMNDFVHTLTDAEVDLTGICRPYNFSFRRLLGRAFAAAIPRIIRPAPEDPFNVPYLDGARKLNPEDNIMPGRHRLDGVVLAVWQGNQALVRDDAGELHRVEVSQDALPVCGQRIEAVGLPETDLYKKNLSNTLWRPASDSRGSDTDVPQNVNVKDIMTTPRGDPAIGVRFYGSLLKFRGIASNVPSRPNNDGLFYVQDGGSSIPVDVSAIRSGLVSIENGCEVEVVGIGVLDTKNWHSYTRFPHATGLRVVARRPSDIRILSHPPWWTPGRLLTLLGILAAALLGAIGWNVSLNRRARAKGRELAAEQLAHVTSELKVNERTRLAVELHDALSQTLTGVSMQIDTAAGFADGKMPAITKCLGLASRTIDACRMELRNTLWDLRSAALDEPSMDAAIRKTLCQNLAGIDLSVRFNVAREVFSDNTAHAVLKIIRELATNSIRHGKATSLKIAGTIDDGKLLFSVRDNGSGFDPDLAPGIAQGHFGLQGIAERLERLNGEMKIESSKGKGAKVTVTLPVPRSGE